MQVELSRQVSGATLQISDNGSGFNLEEYRPGRFGLANMADRAQTIDATFEITSHSGQGTKVVVSWLEG